MQSSPLEDLARRARGRDRDRHLARQACGSDPAAQPQAGRPRGGEAGVARVFACSTRAEARDHLDARRTLRRLMRVPLEVEAAVKPPTKTALFEAAKRWDAAAVAAILAAAPELVTASDPRGRMALHLACAVKPGAAGLAERDGTETAAALLGAGADLEAEVPMDADEGDFRAPPGGYAGARGEEPAALRFLLAPRAPAHPRPW